MEIATLASSSAFLSRVEWEIIVQFIFVNCFDAGSITTVLGWATASARCVCMLLPRTQSHLWCCLQRNYRHFLRFLLLATLIILCAIAGCLAHIIIESTKRQVRFASAVSCSY